MPAMKSLKIASGKRSDQDLTEFPVDLHICAKSCHTNISDGQ